MSTEEQEEEQEQLPRKLTSEEIKQRRLVARQRLVEEYVRCERHITAIEQKLIDVDGWLERDKTSTKQKHHTLYQLEHQLSEKKKKYTQLHKAILF